MAKGNTKHYFELLTLTLTFVFSAKCCRFFLYAALVNFVILQYLALTKVFKYDVFDGEHEMCEKDRDCIKINENRFSDFPSMNFAAQIFVLRIILLGIIIKSTIGVIKDFNVEVVNIKYLVIKMGLYICIQTVDWIIRIKLVGNIFDLHHTNLPIKCQWYKMTLEGVSGWLLFIAIIYIYSKQIKKIEAQVIEKRNKGYIAYETFTEFYAMEIRR